MNKIVFFILLSLISVSVQISLLPALAISRAIPNLILVVAISWLLLGDYKTGFWLLFGSGLLLDLFLGSFFGVTTFVMLLTYIFAYFLEQNFLNSGEKYSKLIIMMLTTVVYNLIYWVAMEASKLLRLSPFNSLVDYNFFASILIQIVLNIILLFFAYRLFKYIKPLLEKWS